MSGLTFSQQLLSAWPRAEWADVFVVVAVSGGADSVALLRALVAARAAESAPTGGLIVAHFHHGLRGAAADADCEFVQRLAEQCHLRCEVGVANVGTLNQPGQDGLEAAARTARYDFLTRTAAKYGARYVATAHNRDDVAETVLHRLLRGTGLVGLTGIPRLRSLSELTTLIRPMLAVTRADVVAYLQQLSQPYCEDNSNADIRFTRNRIRHKLLPQLARDFNPQISAALIRLSQQAEETLTAIDALLLPVREAAVRIVSPTQVHCDRSKLQQLPAAAVRHLLLRVWQEQQWPLQEMVAEKWDEMAAAVCEDLTFDLPGGIRVVSHGAELKLQRR